MNNIIFVHGLESSGQGYKGIFLKRMFPDILTPDFKEFNPNILMYDLTLRLDDVLKTCNIIAFH